MDGVILFEVAAVGAGGGFVPGFEGGVEMGEAFVSALERDIDNFFIGGGEKFCCEFHSETCDEVGDGFSCVFFEFTRNVFGATVTELMKGGWPLAEEGRFLDFCMCNAEPGRHGGRAGGMMTLRRLYDRKNIHQETLNLKNTQRGTC